MFSVTTNPNEATGDGIAMALRAGVPVADVEFVQFHPTALHHPAMPRPLLSEALRGHGALLKDDRGERFVDELAPRDVVSRAMAERMAESGVDHLWLDATALEQFDRRFPTLAESLQRRRPRSCCRLAPDRACRALHLGWRDHGSRRCERASGTVGRRGGVVHRGARSEPPRLQLPARGNGLRCEGCRSPRLGTHRAGTDRCHGRAIRGTS